MSYSGFPVYNSLLQTEALVDRVLSKYKLRGPIQCDLLAIGCNDTYEIKAGRSIYYLRVYRYGWRSKAEIDAELDMLCYLHRQRLPVSRPIKRKDGAYLTRIAAPEGTRYAVLFTNAPGKQAFNPPTQFDMTVAQCRTYGELVAKVHAALDKAPDDKRRFHLDYAHLVEEPLAHIEPFMAHRKADFDYVQNVGRQLWQDSVRKRHHAEQSAETAIRRRGLYRHTGCCPPGHGRGGAQSRQPLDRQRGDRRRESGKPPRGEREC